MKKFSIDRYGTTMTLCIAIAAFYMVGLAMRLVFALKNANIDMLKDIGAEMKEYATITFIAYLFVRSKSDGEAPAANVGRIDEVKIENRT